MKNQIIETSAQLKGSATPGSSHISYSIPRRNRFIDESFVGRSEEAAGFNNHSFVRLSKLNRTTI